jgi:uncharacterized protein (DUF58 family)
MWLYFLALIFVVAGIVGGIAGGGIFTIVLVPIAFIIAVSTFLYSLWSRASTGAAGGEVDAHPSTGRPLPHSFRRDRGGAPSSPERLADARRGQQ